MNKTDSKPIFYSIGVDVSKDKFDACFLEKYLDNQVKIISSKTFQNTISGIKAFISWIYRFCKHKDIQLVVVMEATGIYYEKLAILLNENGINCSVLLPNKVYHYVKSLGQKSKNDILDAKGIAMIGLERKLDVWKPFSKEIYALRQLTRLHQSFVENMTRIRNQIHALKHSGHLNKEAIKSLERINKEFCSQIVIVKKEVDIIINKDDKLSHKIKLLTSIPGVGILTAVTVIAELNGFELFNNINQVVSYCGLDVVENQSGKITGKTRISKKGNSRIRRALFLPSLTIIKLKTDPFYSLYQRVVEKNPNIKMKGVVAIEKKLLITMYSIFKNETPFEDNYHQKSEQNKEKKEESLEKKIEVEESKNELMENQMIETQQKPEEANFKVELATFNKKLARQK